MNAKVNKRRNLILILAALFLTISILLVLQFYRKIFIDNTRLPGVDDYYLHIPSGSDFEEVRTARNSYDFLGRKILDTYDIINVLADVGEQRPPTLFELVVKETWNDVRYDVRNKVRVISGNVQDALKLGSVLTTIKQLWVVKEDLYNPELTQEARIKLGFYLFDQSAVDNLLNKGIFIADEINKAMKDKVEEALRMQIIKIFA